MAIKRRGGGGSLDVAGSPFKCHIGALMRLNGTGTLKNSLDLKSLKTERACIVFGTS